MKTLAAQNSRQLAYLIFDCADTMKMYEINAEEAVAEMMECPWDRDLTSAVRDGAEQLAANTVSFRDAINLVNEAEASRKAKNEFHNY
jgi:hypothetical protein